MPIFEIVLCFLLEIVNWVKYFFFLVCIIGYMNLNSQIHEGNVGIGFAQYYGDLNVVNQGRHPFTFITESFNTKNLRMSYSLGYRYGLKNYLSFGINFYHLYLAGYDSDNESSSLFDDAFYRKVRNLSFYTAVNQFYVDARYEPFRTEERWDIKKGIFSPYISGGLGFFSFNPKTIYQGREIELQPIGTEGQGIKPYDGKYELLSFCIPFSVGFRWINPERVYSIGLDFTYTYTFTDYIDDVSGNYADPTIFKDKYSISQAELVTALANRNAYGLNSQYSYITGTGQQRGNPNSKDNYMTGQVKFTLFLDALERKNAPRFR